MTRPSEAVDAHAALIAALLSLAEHAGAPVCSGDGRWITEYAEQRAEAARLCHGCPVLDLCRAAGEFEDAGVWGGVDRDPGAGGHGGRRAKKEKTE